MAQKAREERAGLRLPSSTGGGNEDERERDELRQERHKERQRQRNIDRAAPDRRSKLERNRERDISEQIALGLPARAAQGTSGDAIFDSRLFNQSKGLSSGFNDDEGINVTPSPSQAVFKWLALSAQDQRKSWVRLWPLSTFE